MNEKEALAEFAYIAIGEFRAQIATDSSGRGAMKAADRIVERYFAWIERQKAQIRVAEHEFDADFASDDA